MIWGNVTTPESLIHNISKTIIAEFPREQLVRYYFFNLECVVATGPDALDEVLRQRPEDFPYPSAVTNAFGLGGVSGLFAEDGDTHKVCHRLVTPFLIPEANRGRSGASQGPFQVVFSAEPTPALFENANGVSNTCPINRAQHSKSTRAGIDIDNE